MTLSPGQISPPESRFLTDRSQVSKVHQVLVFKRDPSEHPVVPSTLVKDLWKKSGFRIHLSFYNWPIWTKYAVSQILIRMSGVTPQQVSWCKYKQSASAQAEPNTEREMTSVSIRGPVSQRPYNPDCRQNGYAHSGSDNPYFKREFCLAHFMVRDEEVKMLTFAHHIGSTCRLYFSLYIVQCWNRDWTQGLLHASQFLLMSHTPGPPTVGL